MAYIDVKSKSDLANLRKKLQTRFLDKKLGEQNLYTETSKLYKPLLEPLKKIAEKTVEKSSEEPTKLLAIEGSPRSTIPAIEQPRGSNDNILRLGNFSEKYLKMLTVKEFDHAYGIKPNEGTSSFRLGRNEVGIDGNDLKIDGKYYKGTEGLWKLLTLKNPGEVSQEDLETYKKMMFQTKAFLLDNDNVQANRGYKYKNIIKPIADEWKITQVIAEKTPVQETSRKRSRQSHDVSGSGMNNVIFLPSDVNDLVSRHSLLFESLLAGNNGVFNELQAINDKLVELKIFDKELIQNINNFINLK